VFAPVFYTADGFPSFDSMGPAIQALPEFLKETKYADPKDAAHTALQKGWKTDLPGFLWIQTLPEKMTVFQEYLVHNRAGMPTFLDVYPVEEKATGANPDRPLFVDVGGGFGTQAVAFRDRHPNLPGKVIVEDLPQAIGNVLKHPGVEAVEHNFFEAQVVKGAKFYYMRNILHDYPDDKSHAILKHTIDALAEDSLILIDDMVLPNDGVHWQGAQLDMLMMATLASRERTEEQWYQLLEGAGLKINKIYTYTGSLKDSIIEAVPASRG
jgi:demethylsterigmatocystin 6-O-methyltransferase